jgi:3-oxoacyl-[acyl-carrier-protein] synthase-3
LKGIRVSGIASVVPSGVKCIEEEQSLFGMSSARLNSLKEDIGINERRITTKDECSSDLCEHAAKFLLSELGYAASTIDCLIMVTSTPDYFAPATSCVLHGKLGLTRDCAAFDVSLGCSGYIYGLWLSSLMIVSGGCKRILMRAGDTLRRGVSPRDQAVAPLFGDGGSATIIENGLEDQQVVFSFHTDGRGYRHLIIPGGAFRDGHFNGKEETNERDESNIRNQEHLYMNGAEVFSFSMREVPPLVDEVLAASGWLKEEVDCFVFHQANKFIIHHLARKLNVSAKKAPWDVFEKYGNQSSASIPVTICEDLWELVQDGAIKVVLAGFGTGLSWAACTLSLGPMACYPVIALE